MHQGLFRVFGGKSRNLLDKTSLQTCNEGVRFGQFFGVQEHGQVALPRR